nr:hypothetical protein [Tanacetum cinerariifolium]
MTSVPALLPVFGALSPVCVDLIPSPKRVRDFGYLADVEVGPRETSFRDDVITRDALRDTGIDARVVVEAVDRDEIEIGVRGPVEVRVERITHPAIPEDILEPAQEGAVIKGVKRDQEHRIVEVESEVAALTERVSELERDNRRLRGTASVENEQEVENGGNENGGSGGNGNRDNRGNKNEGNERNGNGWNRENWNHGMNYGGFMPMARECTFQDFLKCKPHTFSGTEGTIGLTRCALTWWNSHKRTIGVDAAYAMKWVGLMKLITEVYCPRNELMDKKLQGYVARSVENKRSMESNPRDNRRQQQPFKRQNTIGQNVARAYTVGNNGIETIKIQ